MSPRHNQGGGGGGGWRGGLRCSISHLKRGEELEPGSKFASDPNESNPPHGSLFRASPRAFNVVTWRQSQRGRSKKGGGGGRGGKKKVEPRSYPPPFSAHFGADPEQREATLVPFNSPTWIVCSWRLVPLDTPPAAGTPPTALCDWSGRLPVSGGFLPWTLCCWLEQVADPPAHPHPLPDRRVSSYAPVTPAEGRKEHVCC